MTYTKNKQSLVIFLILSLVLISVGFASIASFYPDEIAFKIFLERYFINGGFKQGVASFCHEGFRIKPGILLIPAAMFWSIINLLGNGWISYRILPCLGLLVIYGCLIFQNVKKNNKTFWPLLLLITIGTTLYGLVLLRAEILILSIGMLIYMIGDLALKKRQPGILYLYSFVILTLFSVICYVHPKSIYLLVLVVAIIGLTSVNLEQKFQRIFYIVTFLSFSLLITYDAVELHTKQFLSCQSSATVQSSMVRQAANPIDLIKNRAIFIEDIKLALSAHQLNDGFKRMVFDTNYQIGYLPAKAHKNILDKFANLLIYLTVAGFALYSVRKFIFCAVSLKDAADRKKFYLVAAFSASVFIPLTLNTTRAFYEVSFFVGSLMILATLLWPFQAINNEKYKKYISALPAYMISVSVLCLILAYFNFTKPFWKGYEGPSVSIRTERILLKQQIQQLLLDASISKSEPIIMDDLTYEAVKDHPVVIPATYLMMVRDIPNAMKTALSNHNARYGVTRCYLLDELKRNLAIKNIAKMGYIKYPSKGDSNTASICLFEVL